MAIDSATFKVRFKVFDQVEDTITDAKLEDAQAFLDEAAFSNLKPYSRTRASVRRAHDAIFHMLEGARDHPSPGAHRHGRVIM